MRLDVTVTDPDGQIATLAGGYEARVEGAVGVTWTFPAESPYHVAGHDARTLTFAYTGDVVSALWWSDSTYVMGGANPDPSKFGELNWNIVALDKTKKTGSCRNVRIAPLGQLNTVTLILTDSAGRETVSTRQIVRVEPLAIITAHLPPAYVGEAFAWPLRAAQGVPPYTWTLDAAPAGVTVSTTGTVSVTPDAPGSLPCNVRCTDNRGVTVAQPLTLPVVARPSEGPHDYFDELAARPDCFASYGLRDDAQIAKHRTNPKNETALSYEHPDTTDLRSQDALRIITREGRIGPGQGLRLPAGPSSGQSVLVTADLWIGNELHPLASRMTDWKGAPFHVVSGSGLWIGSRYEFVPVLRAPETQPPGKPFTMLLYPQVVGKGSVAKPPWYVPSTNSGYYLPTNVPTTQARNYPDTIAPVDESVYLGGREWGVVGERWTRVWYYFQRAPEEDWTSEHPTTLGVPMTAYKWTAWMADTERDAMRYVDDAVVGVPASHTGQIVELHAQFSPGNVNETSLYKGRGDLVCYLRNVVVLHGTSKADVLTLLRKPVR